jgi:hypothetical protein
MVPADILFWGLRLIIIAATAFMSLAIRFFIYLKSTTGNQEK